ncbi:MAG: tetratricopeptide repeat protein [Polyangiaceae bacterium]
MDGLEAADIAVQAARSLPFATHALALTCILFGTAALAGCSRKSTQEDASSWDAASTTRGGLTFGQGGCGDIAACQKRCDDGDGDQCRRLGDTFQFAPDGGRDEARAVVYYVHACEMGNAVACLSAGHMFEYHHGVPEDDSRAAGYYKSGCDKGHMPSCANYAIMLENGRGVAKDVASAIKLYRDACSAGAGLACDRSRALSREAGAEAPP